MQLLVRFALLSLIAPTLQAQEDVPPIFAKLAFDKALEQNKTDQKILVVKATATWCGPCKQMDRTTWRDEKVVKWFETNGVAIHFDVDLEKPLAKKLDIQAMPTMIAFKKGEEFDRIVGYKGPTDFVEWLDGVKAGRKSIEAVRERAKNAPPGTDAEIETRMELARSLQQKGELDKATEEYVWLWEHTANTSFAGVRGSFMASDIERLAAKHAPAKERFLRFRDEATKQLEGEKVDPEAFDDWIVLNSILGEPQKTLEWFDKTKTDVRWLPLLRREAFRIEDQLIPAKRWSDVAILHPDPVADLLQAHEMLEMSARFRPKGGSEPLPPDIQEMERGRFRTTASQLYVAMLAAKEAGRARDVVKKALEFDDSAEMRMALVRLALTAKQEREEQKALLDDAEKKGAEPKALAKLREKLAKALEPSTGN